jgi:hypothetical protein
VLQHCNYQGSKIELQQQSLSGSIMALSDGSVVNNRGTAAAVIQSNDGNHQMCIQAHVPTTTDNCSSFRSELFGIYLDLIGLYQWNDSLPPHVALGCDNLAAVNIVNANEPHQVDYDIVAAISFVKKQLTTSITVRHIYGHQDRNGGVLDHWAKLNVQVDKLAEATHQLPRQVGPLWTNSWSISIGFATISKNIASTVYAHAAQRNLAKYWKEKQPLRYHDVHTFALSKALKTLPPARQRWVTKHAVGICGVNKWMYRWKWHTTDCCPRCNAAAETAQHIYICPNEAAVVDWKAAMENAARRLEKIKTPRRLQRYILRGLQTARGLATHPVVEAGPLAEVMQRQSQIGWEALFEGWWCKGWMEAYCSESEYKIILY